MKCLNLSTNLAARYQYSENVRTLRFLVPAFAGLGTLNLLAALSLPYIYLQFAQGASRGANIQLVYQVGFHKVCFRTQYLPFKRIDLNRSK